MFNPFSRRTIPKISPILLQQIKAEFNEMIAHINSAMRLTSNENIMEPVRLNSNENIMELEPLEARKRLRQVRFEIEEGYACFHNVVDIWTTGKPVFRELELFFEALRQLIHNLEQWAELIHKPDFDIFNSKYKCKYQEHVFKSRRLGTKVDSQLNKANSKLKELTGLEFPPIGE